jgi:hypothetical protein
MESAAGPVEIVFDPHVQNALEALFLALVVALVAVGLQGGRRRRR